MKSDRERYRRVRRRSVEVDCTVEVGIDEFETEVLVEELRSRRAAAADITDDFKEEVEAAYEALRAGRSNEAEWILERLLWPKWPTVEACEEQKTKMQ